jgi:hypothetical protein
MAIGAPYHALVYLSLDRVNRVPFLSHVGDFFSFSAPDVVKLQDDRIVLPAIHARVGGQIIPNELARDRPELLFALPSICLVSFPIALVPAVLLLLLTLSACGLSYASILISPVETINRLLLPAVVADGCCHSNPL